MCLLIKLIDIHIYKDDKMRDMFVELLDAKKCKIYKENEFEEQSYLKHIRKILNNLWIACIKLYS